MTRMPPAVLVLLALAFPAGARADYYVVVSEKNPVMTLSEPEALHLFMGGIRAFPDGHAAVTYDLNGAAQRAGFYHALAGMSLAQVNSYWARLMFSGRSLPPRPLNDELTMSETVSRDPNALGWLLNEPSGKGLRVVLVLKAAP